MTCACITGNWDFDSPLLYLVVCHLLGVHYLRQNNDSSWPPVKTTNFVQLALIKEGQTVSQRTTVQASVDTIVGNRETLAYQSIFENVRFKFILLEGRPGSGKTTLLSRISHDWANRNILTQNYRLFVYILLRRVNDESDLSLGKILSTACPSLTSRNIQELVTIIERSQGGHVVFAFDGLDEYKRINEENNIIKHLLQGEKLPQASIVVTSRPDACAEFRQYATIRIEVIGFLVPQVIQYIHHYFDEDRSRANQLVDHLKEHPNLMNMAYLPLHCTMLAFLYQEDAILPETETEFYKLFTLSTLLRSMHKRRGKLMTLRSYESLPGDEKKVFFRICKLAFNATVESKQVFTCHEIKHISTEATPSSDELGSLGLIVVDCFLMRYGIGQTFTFLHLTFQEYLAAVHIATLPESQRNNIIKAHRDKRHLSVMWRFLCGTLDVTNVDTMKTFADVMNTNKSVLFKLQCCYEAQHSLACAHVISTFHGKIELRNQTLAPTDCLAVGYAVNRSCYPNIELDLHQDYLSSKCTTAASLHSDVTRRGENLVVM